jgi:hypothetical protein
MENAEDGGTNLPVMIATAKYNRYVCQLVTVNDGSMKLMIPPRVTAAREMPEHLVLNRIKMGLRSRRILFLT